MFTPTFRLPWDYVGCGTPRIELQKINNEWRASLLNFDVDGAINGFDGETLEQLSEIFQEASNYIKRTDVNTPFLFEENNNELQDQSEPRSGTMGSKCC
jgi:hypothetical protein